MEERGRGGKGIPDWQRRDTASPGNAVATDKSNNGNEEAAEAQETPTPVLFFPVKKEVKCGLISQQVRTR